MRKNRELFTSLLRFFGHPTNMKKKNMRKREHGTGREEEDGGQGLGGYLKTFPFWKVFVWKN